MKVLFFTRSGPGVRHVPDDYGNLPRKIWLHELTPVICGWGPESPTTVQHGLRVFKLIIYTSSDYDIALAWERWGLAFPLEGPRLQIPIYVEAAM